MRPAPLLLTFGVWVGEGTRRLPLPLVRGPPLLGGELDELEEVELYELEHLGHRGHRLSFAAA